MDQPPCTGTAYRVCNSVCTMWSIDWCVCVCVCVCVSVACQGTQKQSIKYFVGFVELPCLSAALGNVTQYKVRLVSLIHPLCPVSSLSLSLSLSECLSVCLPSCCSALLPGHFTVACSSAVCLCLCSTWRMEWEMTMITECCRGKPLSAHQLLINFL